MVQSVQKVRKLYKTILKLHRGLPKELSELGTNYARDAFKRHKKCTPKQAELFMQEWTDYALSLAKQLGLRGPHTGTSHFGKSLTEEDLDKFQDEQIHQLHELMEAAKDNKQPNR